MKTATHILPNGIPLIYTHLADSQICTLYVLIKKGSLHEDIPGLAHMVEHMVFKGTKKRPTALDINNEIERVGGFINAATSQEFTEYYIKIPVEFCEKACDVLSDMLTQYRFTDEDLDKEKNVVLEEIHMYEDMPMRNVSDTFYSLVWPEDGLGRPILGFLQTIQHISREDIYRYTDSFYTADNMVLSIAGNIPEKDAILFANTYFGSIQKSTHALDIKDIPYTINTTKKVSLFDDAMQSIRIENRNVKQVHFCYGMKALAYKHEDLPALEVASAILAEGSGSYLWQKVREELGASYYLEAELDPFEKTGIWYIHCGVDKTKAYEVLRIMTDAFAGFADGLFKESDLHRAKEYLKGDFVMALEGSEEICRYAVHEFIERNYVPTIQEQKEMTDAVSLFDVNRIMFSLFSQKRYINILTRDADLTIVREIVTPA